MLELLFTVLFLGAVQSHQDVGESCFDNKNPGVCTVLTECESVIDEIKEGGQPMSMAMRRRLKKITCGYKMKELLVCCVPKNVTSKPPVTDPNAKDNSGGVDLETRAGPPDVKEHPNLYLLPSKCGSIESNRIWGGNRTALFEMPWMVLLSYTESRTKFDCGGTIINQWYILTAAHCVKAVKGKARLAGVILGEYDVRTDPDCEVTNEVRICAPKMQEVGIGEVIAHTGYDNSSHINDIALIRLAEPANFSLDTMKPICLPVTPDLQKQVMKGINGIVAGWGVTETGLQSPVLLSVDLPIMRHRDCNAYFKGDPQITEKQICAGGVKNKDSCGGDSGGPLMYPGRVGFGIRYVQRGIVSFGSKRCAIVGFPGVYTRVAYYVDWILDNIRE